MPRLTPRSITVPLPQTSDPINLETSKNIVFSSRPVLFNNLTFQKFADIYQKFKVYSITITVIPHQNTIWYFNTQGANDPLKYVVYRVSPDTIGTATTPIVTGKL